MNDELWSVLSYDGNTINIDIPISMAPLMCRALTDGLPRHFSSVEYEALMTIVEGLQLLYVDVTEDDPEFLRGVRDADRNHSPQEGGNLYLEGYATQYNKTVIERHADHIKEDTT